MVSILNFPLGGAGCEAEGEEHQNGEMDHDVFQVRVKGLSARCGAGVGFITVAMCSSVYEGEMSRPSALVLMGSARKRLGL